MTREGWGDADRLHGQTIWNELQLPVESQGTEKNTDRILEGDDEGWQRGNKQKQRGEDIKIVKKMEENDGPIHMVQN